MLVRPPSVCSYTSELRVRQSAAKSWSPQFDAIRSSHWSAWWRSLPTVGRSYEVVPAGGFGFGFGFGFGRGSGPGSDDDDEELEESPDDWPAPDAEEPPSFRAAHPPSTSASRNTIDVVDRPNPSMVPPVGPIPARRSAAAGLL